MSIRIVFNVKSFMRPPACHPFGTPCSLLADSFLSFSMVQIRAHVPWPIFFAWYFCLRCSWIHLQDTYGPRFLFPSKVTTQVRLHASSSHILYLCLGTPLKLKKLALESFVSTNTHLQFLLPLYALFLDVECTSAFFYHFYSFRRI